MQSPKIIDLPTSRICLAAQRHARTVSQPFLFNHVMRSFIFADAAGIAMGATVDRELLFLSCVLHDLGLVDAALVATRFEVEGADAADAFALEHGMEADRRAILWDAIALHTTPVIPQRKRPEVALCQLGTAIDVGFAPTAAIAPAIVVRAVAAYPRMGFKKAMPRALCGLAKRNPGAACQSYAVAEAARRLIDGIQIPDICDVMAAADFED